VCADSHIDDALTYYVVAAGVCEAVGIVIYHDARHPEGVLPAVLFVLHGPSLRGVHLSLLNCVDGY
jgi:hypothetical protein